MNNLLATKMATSLTLPTKLIMKVVENLSARSNFYLGLRVCVCVQRGATFTFIIYFRYLRIA